MLGRIIETEADLAEGASWLAQAEPRFAPVLAQTGPLPLRRQAGGFSHLLNAIIGQQVSTASAAAIWQRMIDNDMTTLENVRAASDDDLRACGLSRPKMVYAKSLAAAEINYETLASLPDATVIDTLIAVKGIGRWTAEVYALFSLGRADVFAPGDLALQESARVLFDLTERPKEATFRTMAEAWSPWRGVAARALWAYYRVLKNREGIR